MSPPQPPPSYILPSLSESHNRIQSECGHDNIHQCNDVDPDNNNNPSIDLNHGQHGEKTETPQPARTCSSSSAPSPSRTRLQSTRHTKAPSSSSSTYYKHSLPHRRVLRSFPRLPHAFAQPSTNRYLPYIPISISVRRTVEHDTINDTEKGKEAQPVSDPVIPSVVHDSSQEEVEEK